MKSLWVNFNLIIVLMLLSISANAQYLGDKIALENYAGKWKWETENESFTLYLIDTTWLWGEDATEVSCAIVGTYKYVKNDSTIVDNTGMHTDPIDMPIFAMEAQEYTDDNGSIWALWVVVEDTNTRKMSDDEYSTLKYSLGRSGPLLTMSLSHDHPWFEGIEEQMAAITGEDPNELKAITAGCKLPSFSCPEVVTFTKVVE